MRVLRGIPSPNALASASALTIGNFDGVHRGHQAMLARLVAEARQRSLVPTVLTFEPHPRDFFAQRSGRLDTAPARIATLRDKLIALADAGIEQTVVMRFNERLAALDAQAFIERVIRDGLRTRHLLIGDDFRFGARRVGDHAMLQAAAPAADFDLARMPTHDVEGMRVSSSAVRAALARGDMALAETLLGRPYRISGRAIHGRKLGRELGFRTLNLRFAHARPAASGIFVAQVHGLAPRAVPAVASLGVRPTVEDSGRVLLEAHCLRWPETLDLEGGYGRCVQVDLLHKLHDERQYDGLSALREAIAHDTAQAQAWFQARQLA